MEVIVVALSQLSETMQGVLERSAFEASAHHHEFQQPGHLFLALLSRVDNPAGRVLNAYGLMYENVLPIILSAYQPHIAGRNVVEKFSTDATNVINAAEEIAQTDGNRSAPTRPHHLLVALINSNDAVVTKIFADLGVDPKLVVRRLDYEVADTDHLN